MLILLLLRAVSVRYLYRYDLDLRILTLPISHVPQPGIDRHCRCQVVPNRGHHWRLRRILRRCDNSHDEERRKPQAMCNIYI